MHVDMLWAGLLKSGGTINGYLGLVPLSSIDVVLEHVHHGLTRRAYERRVHLPPVDFVDLLRSVWEMYEIMKGWGEIGVDREGRGGDGDNIQGYERE